MIGLGISEDVKGLVLFLRTLKFIFPFIYVSFLPASSLQCDLSSPKQYLSTLSLYSYQKQGLELSSGPASPLSSILEEPLECCQLSDGRNQTASLIKVTRTMVSLSSILSSPCHWIDMVIVGTYPTEWNGLSVLSVLFPKDTTCNLGKFL